MTRARFEAEVLPAAEPLVIRGLVDDWKAVRLGRSGGAAAQGSESAPDAPPVLAQWLASLDSGQPVDAVMTPPEAEGRLSYDETMAGFNFLRNRLPVSQVLEQVLRYARFDRAPAVAVQSALLSRCLPGFAAEHPMPLLDAHAAPRIWLGTAIVTPAHFDESHNIACCVAGRRRFTILPPAQIANLYVGPLDHAPTGTPMSLVDFARPDLERHPRFAEALAHARAADLAPGDAIYIPPLWWHHVRSLERFNVLVNYWWVRTAPGHAPPPSALDALVHAVASLRGLPDPQRQAWREVFEHYLFDTGRDVAGHIPPERRGVLGELSADDHARLRAHLAGRLGR